MSGGFLDRWSRRKLARAGKTLLADAPPSAVAAAAAVEPGDQAALAPGDGAPLPGAGGVIATAAAEAGLPPVEELTLASDFTAFLKEEVSEALRRQALHKLFADPHFNRMDGLDIYIDDYSLPDPIPPEAMAKLKHAREWLMANEAEAEAKAGIEAQGVEAHGVEAQGATVRAEEPAGLPAGEAGANDWAADAVDGEGAGREPGATGHPLPSRGGLSRPPGVDSGLADAAQASGEQPVAAGSAPVLDPDRGLVNRQKAP